MRLCCDSVVVLGRRARRGKTLFAKNSDRPPGESQPLVRAVPADFPPGSRLACQYIEIEQAGHTYGFIGSRPDWLWGLEHGVNEHRVAIGNHTIYTRDPLPSRGLLGMDLVRLGLERAASASEAAGVITALIERYGQGGSGFRDMDWPYHNSFLIADPHSAYLLEASGRQWAIKEVEEAASASNHVTIGTDWTRLSPECVDHARRQGWWNGGGRFDFARAYRDTSVVPPQVSSGRYETTCRALLGGKAHDVEGLERLMRDHYESGELYRPGPDPSDERFFSVCMHAGAVGTTAASMVVELDPDAPLLVHVALTSPCTAPYIPLFGQAPLAPALMEGGAEPSRTSAWWRFDRLRELVAEDWQGRAPRVRDYWRPREREWREEAQALAASAAGPQELADFNASVWQRASADLERLIAELESDG